MLKKTGWLSAGLTLAAFSAVASFAPGSVGSAQAAVVYCKTAGVPQGCVVRPTPVATAAVVDAGGRRCPCRCYPRRRRARRRRRPGRRCSSRHTCMNRGGPVESRWPPRDANSAGGSVAVGKPMRQCQPHASALSAGVQHQRRATPRRAASHVAQAARRFRHPGGSVRRGDVKPLAVVFDRDAAASRPSPPAMVSIPR